MKRKIIILSAVALALVSANIASARCGQRYESSCPSKPACKTERPTCKKERPACKSSCKKEKPACPSRPTCEKKSSCPFDVSAWYVRASGSADWHRDITLKNTTPTTEDIEFNLGWNVAGSIGAEIDQWRLEIEGQYRTNDIDKLKNSTTALSYDVNGDVSHFALMFNVFYDIPIHDCFSVYLGGGVGVDFFNLEVDAYPPAATYPKIDEKDTLFAWQLMGGVSYDVTEQVALFVGYRFFATTKPDDFTRNLLTTSYEDFLYSHSVEGGIRFKF